MAFAQQNPGLVHRMTIEPVAADISRRTLDRMLRRAALVYKADEPGKDVWKVADPEGDCEDHALRYKRDLLARGIPHEALSIALWQLPDGAWHAGLLVTTKTGPWMMCCLNGVRRPPKVPLLVEGWGRPVWGWLAGQPEPARR